MFRSIAAGVALAFGLTGAAAAEPAESFLTFCLANDARADAVARSADKAGWNQLSEADIAKMNAAVGIGATAFTNLDPEVLHGDDLPADFEGLVMGRTEDERDAPSMDICMVVTPRIDQTVLERRITETLGMAPAAPDGERAWFYSRVGGTFKSEADTMGDEDAIVRVLAERDILFVTVTPPEDGLSVLVMGAVRRNAD